MDMKKIQELPTPEDLKKEFPLPYKVQKIKKQRDQEIEDIFKEDKGDYNYYIGLERTRTR